MSSLHKSLFYLFPDQIPVLGLLCPYCLSLCAVGSLRCPWERGAERLCLTLWPVLVLVVALLFRSILRDLVQMRYFAS